MKTIGDIRKHLEKRHLNNIQAVGIETIRTTNGPRLSLLQQNSRSNGTGGPRNTRRCMPQWDCGLVGLIVDHGPTLDAILWPTGIEPLSIPKT